MEDECFFSLTCIVSYIKRTFSSLMSVAFSPFLMDRKCPPPTSGSQGTLSCKLRIVKISLLLVMYVLTQQWRQGNVFALNIGMLLCNRVVLRPATCWENFSPSLLHPSFGQARLSGKRSNSPASPARTFWGANRVVSFGMISWNGIVESFSWKKSMEQNLGIPKPSRPFPAEKKMWIL